MTDKSWSGLRKALEQDFLCPALRGRVQYFLTHYHAAPDQIGRFCIRVDGQEYVMANPYSFWQKGYPALENSIKRERGIPPREWSAHGMLHEAENEAVEDEVRRIAQNDGVFDMWDIIPAIETYRSSPISESLASPVPLIRLLAYLDRRVGKRTLERLKETETPEPEWLQFFLRLRLEAEGI